MAKGRRLTTSRSERYLGSSYGYSNGYSHMAGADAAELGEEEVWSMIEGSVVADNNESRSSWSPRAESNDNNGNFSYMGRPSVPSRDGRNLGGLSLAFEDSIPFSEKTMSSNIVHNFRGQHDGMAPQSARHVATSAPVNVPNWSKIYRVESVESLHDSDDGMDDRQMVPPHEYLAREYGGRRKHGGGSVFEGVGRTLKGRDLWRVRDTVWRQTGFDG